jgi:beta-lactam-binding protein with PASTA domain
VVRLTVAQAGGPVAVPPVVGLTAADAQSRLASEGFKADERSRDVGDASKDGVVVSQKPRAGGANWV